MPQPVDKPQIKLFSGCQPNFVFSATGESEKLLVRENPLNKRVFKVTGVVLAERNKRFAASGGIKELVMALRSEKIRA